MKTLVTLRRRTNASAPNLGWLSRLGLLVVWKGVAAGTMRAVHGLQEGDSRLDLVGKLLVATAPLQKHLDAYSYLSLCELLCKRATKPSMACS